VKISFDLDDTLIPGSTTFPTEKRNAFQKLLGIERIRESAVKLMKQLKSEGHSICVYTTSFRKTFKIRFAFWTYGILLDRVINQTMHDEVLREKKNLCSKYPPAFNIDLHVDDSIGVGMEGQRFKFKTVIISDDGPWVNQIVSALKECQTKL
jgi:hypothetical protein